MSAIVVSAERFRNASSAASNELSSKTSNDEFRDETERREHEQAGFLASLEAEPSENVIAGPAKWFDHSPWRTPHLYSTWPRALVRKAELESGREEIPPGAIGMRMMAASGDAAKAEFEAAMQAIGLEIPRGGVIADGEIHRCNASGSGNHGKGDGAYCLHLDGDIPYGWFQDHRDGVGVRRWHFRTGQKFTKEEVAAFKEKVRKQRAARAAHLVKVQVETAERARAIFDGAEDAPADHTYLVEKKIRLPDGVRYSAAPVAISQWRNSSPSVLLVPMRDVEGALWNLQVVDGDGRKDFLAGGRVKGCFFVVGGADMLFPAPLNLIGEGLATVASCFEAMDVPAIAAFNCGNLEPVARVLHDAYSKAKLLVCGDDDWQTKDATGELTNPGKKHAIQAAKAIGAEAVFPVFSPSHHREDDEKDFNDLAKVEGLSAVRACIEAAQTVKEQREREQEHEAYNEKIEKIEAAVLRLAALSEVVYLTRRTDEAKALDINVTDLDRAVKEARRAAKADIARQAKGEKEKEYAAAIRATYEILGEARDLDNASWALVVTSRDRDGKPHDLLLSRAELIADYKWLERWANHGFSAPSSTKGKAILRQELLEAACDKRVRLVWRTGWHGHIFVLPDTVYGASEEVYRYAGDARGVLYGQKGTLGEWRAEVAAMATGNSRLILGMSLAFSGPLFDLFEVETIGVHFEGPSSTGKSTAGFGAGSVWGGGGRNGFTQSWRATGNGLEGIAKAHSGTLLCLEEIGEIDPKVGSVAYMLLNGHGKGRASKDGEARARAEWRMPILSSGEIGIAAKIREGRGTPKQGQLVRIIDLPADAGKGLGVFENIHGAANAAEFANTLKAAALRHYGVAGDAFLREITENVDEVREYVSRRIKALMEQWGIDGDNGQVSRVAHRLAIVAAAGELARDKLDLPWGEEEVETAVYACFNAWLESRGGSGAGEIMDAIHKLRSVIDAHGEARFLNLDKLDEGEEPRIPVRDLLGYRFGKGDAVIWAFTESAWKETLGGVADLRFLERELHRRGIIQVTTSQLQQKRFRLAKKIKGRSCRVAAVCAAKLFDEGDDPEQTSF